MVTITPEQLSRYKKYGTWGFVIFVVLLCIASLIPNSPVRDFLLAIFNATQNLPSPVAALIIITINIICVIFMIPSTPITIYSGIRLGVFFGTCASQIGCFVGCIIVYHITRHFLYETVNAWIQKNKLMQSIQKIVEKHGIVFITLLRASPLFPFPLINYAIPPVVSFRNYAIGSFIGLIPANFIVCYISVSITDIADAFVKNTLDGSSTVMMVVIIGLTVGLLIAISVYIKVELKKLEREEQQQSQFDEEKEMHNEQNNENNENIITLESIEGGDSHTQMSNTSQNDVISIDALHHDISDGSNVNELKSTATINTNINVTDNANTIEDDHQQMIDVNMQHQSQVQNDSYTNFNANYSYNNMNMNEKKRVSSPPMTTYESSSVGAVIIEEEDTYSHQSYGYDSGLIGSSKASVIIDDDEDMIQLNNDDDDVIIIDPNE